MVVHTYSTFSHSAGSCCSPSLSSPSSESESDSLEDEDDDEDDSSAFFLGFDFGFGFGFELVATFFFELPFDGSFVEDSVAAAAVEEREGPAGAMEGDSPGVVEEDASALSSSARAFLSSSPSI